MAKKTDGQSVSQARGVHAASTPPARRTVKRDESRAPQAAARSSALVDTRVIYCGDNLDQLKKLPDACVDLIYIDPPFNSNRNYEIFWPETSEKRRFDDRHESTKAYIEYMRPRCEQLARVLKKTGSFYYHCDWHASHYVKVMLDQIFGENNFVNEIVWKRSDAKSDVGQGAKHFGRVHDSIFYYANGEDYTFNAKYNPLPQSTVDSWYKHIEEGTGRHYNKADVTGPGGAAKGCPVFEWKGITRAWRYSKANMERLEKEGRLVYSKTGMVYQKRYLDESKGVSLSSWWDDIDMLRGISSGKERLGYPTQKPLKLLERIIQVSSNENDIVLDAFCGCGTAILAAQNLNRQWIGIDISPTSCSVMAKRLRDNTTLREDEDLWKVGRGFVVQNLPFTVELLRKMPPFEFENWAVKQLNGRANKVQIGDKGIDGRIYPVGVQPRESGAGELALEESWYPIQVKQKDKAGRPDMDAFETAMRRAARTKGFFVSFDYSEEAEREVTRFWKEEQRTIILLTVKELLDGNFAHKLV